MIREAKQGHLQFTSQWMEQRGKVSRIQRKGGGNTKKSGAGERKGEEIDNPEKKLKILSWILSSVIHFV